MIKELFIKILIIAMIVLIVFPLCGMTAFYGHEVGEIIIWAFVGVPSVYFIWRIDLKKAWGQRALAD